MYYPYLRAKQYELKALREFGAAHRGQTAITPILEPVKQQTNALSLAVKEMMENKMKFALILNPKDGDFKHTTVNFNILEEDLQLTDYKELWIPAFIYSKNSVEIINATIDEFGLTDVMIIFRKCIDIDDANALQLLGNKKVKYVVNTFGTTVSRRLKRQLKDLVDNVIRLDDCFQSQVRNADYANDDDELFSEEPFFYETEEGFDGYSDYTTLPSEYIEGGMLPYALAIHFTYKKNEDQLYVHHFVSDNNETNNDIRGKFREAARKVAPFFAGKATTPAVVEIITRADDTDGYPGLGYLKKLSILNHLELIHSLK